MSLRMSFLLFSPVRISLSRHQQERAKEGAKTDVGTEMRDKCDFCKLTHVHKHTLVYECPHMRTNELNVTHYLGYYMGVPNKQNKKVFLSNLWLVVTRNRCKEYSQILRDLPRSNAPKLLGWLILDMLTFNELTLKG